MGRRPGRLQPAGSCLMMLLTLRLDGGCGLNDSRICREVAPFPRRRAYKADGTTRMPPRTSATPGPAFARPAPQESTMRNLFPTPRFLHGPCGLLVLLAAAAAADFPEVS